MTSNLDSESDVENLFADALEIPTAKQKIWLEEQCQSNPETLKEVLSLLEAHHQSGQFLTEEACLDIGLQEAIDRRGTRVGAYEIDATIARGGMGSVYRAHRVDGAYDQTVAIKIVSASLFESSLFQSERQILANLEHPAITTILDGGHIAASDELYLVMEYVDGEDIISYVRQNQPPKAKRLELLLILLEALELAHRKGVIHCDLKPDNILIDTNGQLRLLDFGIAHATNIASNTEPAQSTPRGLTPKFSSPQRLAGDTPTISDDIYSMGILMAMVLTPPIQPSASQLSTPTLDNITSALDTEAQAIVDKAMHARPSKRYPSAQALADELRGWISHQPVAALNGGLLYRFKKSLKRNLITWIAISFLLGLVLMSALAWWSQHKSKQTAQQNSVQIRAVVQLAKTTVQDLDDQLRLLPGSTNTRLTSAENTITQLEEMHQSQPENPQLIHALIRTHARIGLILSNPKKLHFGDFNQGRAHLKRAYELATAVHKRQSTTETLVDLLLAENQVVNQLAFVEGKIEDALVLSVNRLNMLKQAASSDDSSDVSVSIRIRAHYFRIASLLLHLGKTQEAAFGLKKAEALFNASVKPNKNMKDKGAKPLTQERKRRQQNIVQYGFAIQSMLSGDFIQSTTLFLAYIDKNAKKKSWNDRRYITQAHHAIACIALLDKQDTSMAQSHLLKAKKEAADLVEYYPAALSPKWLLSTYANVESETNNQHTASEWITQFSCDKLEGINLPPAPPNGWQLIRDQLDFSFSDIVVKPQT